MAMLLNGDAGPPLAMDQGGDSPQTIVTTALVRLGDASLGEVYALLRLQGQQQQQRQRQQ